MFSRKSLTRIFLASVFISLFTFSLRLIASGPHSAPDYDGMDRGAEVIITVADGDTGASIARKLQAVDVVKSSESFFRVAVADKRSTRIAPGEHRVDTRISAREALDQLLDSKRIENVIAIRDGAWVSEVIQSMQEAGFARADIKVALKNFSTPKGFSLTGPEGFLYPAFYPAPQGTTVSELLTAMTNRFIFSTKGVNWQAMKGFTADQILIIASLIETEGTPDVHAKVSRVIYNRLAKRMPLQLDSTIHYILQRRGEIRVSLTDTKVSSRYNTFANPGLPPGPIGSPTRASIDAALAPEPGDWLYFVTVKPGDTRFTSSYDEFLQFKNEYKKNLAAGLFR